MPTIPYPNILLDALEIGVIIIDDQFKVRYWNKWLEINTGIEPAKIVGENLQTFYPQIDYKVFSRKIRTTLRLHSPTFYDASLQNRFLEIPRTKITTSLLTTMQLQVTIAPYIPEQSMVMVSIYDISDLHELKLNLQHQMQTIAKLNDELYREKAIIDSNLLIAKIDSDCCVLEVTQAFVTFFGYKRESLLGRPLSYVFGEGSIDFDSKHMRDVIASQQRWSGEVKAFLENGDGIWLDAVVNPITDDNHEIRSYTVIFHDISDKKRIELLSITDPLTKLFNRRKFDEVFEQMIMRQHWNKDASFSLIMIDIDHFKRLNDTYGHQVGDKVLMETAQVLTQTVRTGDVLARWGGEEFACLLPDVNVEKALHVAQKLRSAIEMLDIPEAGVITASLGVSLYKIGDTEESLIQRADTALYRAKENGRNRVESY
ncbi:MAG: diguanylate cyclase [Sulfuricurvum sp.]|nr:diguanylate cyclase [Sulfuricurvum sp.]